MQHQGDIAGQVQGLKPSIKVLNMIRESIRTSCRLSGLPHPYEVWSQAPTQIADVRDDISP
jgi:hypothetical protein